MSIKQAKDGYFRTTISYDGKVYGVCGKTESECLKKAGALRQKLETGTKLAKKGRTVSDFAEEWLSIYRCSGTSNDTRYEQIVRKVICPAIGSRKISSITERDLQKILNDNAGYSKSQLSKIRMTLKQIFKKAQKNHLIIDNPSDDLKLPKCNAGTHRALTSEERKRVIDEADRHSAGLYIKIMLYCGLRPAEVDALQWRYVDLDKKIIHVRQAVKHGTNIIGTPKTKAGIRDVPIPAALVEELERAKQPDGDAYVCTNERGEHHTSASRNRMWHSFLRQMDIDGGATVYRNRIIESTVADDLTLYCLRHTYCTDLQRAGVPLNVAKVLMGHEDISVTANIYTHTSEDDARTAIDNLDEYIKATDS